MDMNDRDRERVKKLLTDAVTLLCKSSVSFDEEVAVEGLIGITVDRKDIILVSIRETLQQTFHRLKSQHSEDEDSRESSQSAKRRKRHRSASSSSSCDTERSEYEESPVDYYLPDSGGSVFPQRNHTAVQDTERNQKNPDIARNHSFSDCNRSFHFSSSESNNHNMDQDHATAPLEKPNLPAKPQSEESTASSSAEESPAMDLAMKRQAPKQNDCMNTEEQGQQFPVIDWPGAAGLEMPTDSVLPTAAYHPAVAFFLQQQQKMAAAAGSLGSGGPVFPTDMSSPPSVQASQKQQKQQNQELSPPVPSQSDTDENKNTTGQPGRKWYRCAFCGVGYNWKQSYQRHLLLKHLGQGYMCPLCSRRFARKDHLQRHFYNCKRRYGVTSTDDPGYIASLSTAAAASLQQNEGQESTNLSNHTPVYRGRGRPRGSRNKNRSYSVDSHNMMASAFEGSLNMLSSIASATDANLSLLSSIASGTDLNLSSLLPAQNTQANNEKEAAQNDTALLLPIYRAARQSSQVSMNSPVFPSPENGNQDVDEQEVEEEDSKARQDGAAGQMRREAQVYAEETQGNSAKKQIATEGNQIIAGNSELKQAATETFVSHMQAAEPNNAMENKSNPESMDSQSN